MPRPLLLAAPLLAAAGLAGAGTGLALRPRSAPVVQVATPSPSATAPALVVVDVAGAVVRPGVLRLPSGSRVIDAIGAAGGLKPDADPSALNKAQVLRDGVRVYVPRQGEVVVPPSGSEGSALVDINTAGQRELEGLPGVGPATAQRIVRSREQKPFTRAEELQTRGLVSARLFADIRDLVTVR